MAKHVTLAALILIVVSCASRQSQSDAEGSDPRAAPSTGSFEVSNLPYSSNADWSTTPAEGSKTATGLVLADIDGDAYKDLVVAYGNDVGREDIVIYKNTYPTTGRLGFNRVWTSSLQSYHGKVAAGDLDGDGCVDLVATVGFTLSFEETAKATGTEGLSPGKILIYSNRRSSSHGQPRCLGPKPKPTQSLDPGIFTIAVELGDFDGDADLDIAATPLLSLRSDGLAAPRVFLNDQGTFEPNPAWIGRTMVRRSGGARAADTNGDGALDLAIAALPPVVFHGDGGSLEETAWDSKGGLPFMWWSSVGWEIDAMWDAARKCHILATAKGCLVWSSPELCRQRFNYRVDYLRRPAPRYSTDEGYGYGVSLRPIDGDDEPDLLATRWGPLGGQPKFIFHGGRQGCKFGARQVLDIGAEFAGVPQQMDFSDLRRRQLLIETKELKPPESGHVLTLPYGPAERILLVTKNGKELNPLRQGTAPDYVVGPRADWISFREAFTAADRIAVKYERTRCPDLAVANWNEDGGDRVYLNRSTGCMED